MTRRAYTPRPYAGRAMAHFRNVPRCALWAGMGLGKTVITLTHLDIRHNVWGEDRPTLVLAPLRVARSTWPDEVHKWDHLSGLEVVPMVGTVAERVAALRRDAPIKTINYDNLVWLLEQFPSKAAWPFRLVVADEATRLKNFRLTQGGARARALGQVAHAMCDEMIELSGTPAPNGLKDLWGQMWFLDEGQRLGRTYKSFEDRYFAWKRAADAFKKGKDGVQQIILPHSQELIHEKLADLCLTIDPKDYFDLAEPIVNVIEVDMPRTARAQYRELEREMFFRLETGEEIEVFNAASLSMKCLQMANGAVYLEDGKTWKVTHDEKIDALASVVEEAGGAPILVAYHFKSDLARLQRAFPDGRHLDADPRTIDAWNAGRIPILFAHPASAGHGLNLQDGGNTVVFFGHWWDLEQHDQIIERIGPVRQMQAGHNRPVFIHYIVARDTVDELVMARRESKRDVQDLLLDYMKGKQ
jgi:SNF2 family DNA or RNA helicase